MPIGNFTRQTLEARATDQLNTAISALGNLANLDQRMKAEFAAGTLDGPDFYQGDPEDKANILGMLDQAAAVYAWIAGKGQVAPPSGDPMLYAQFVIGLG
jgi:hypothetical protein